MPSTKKRREGGKGLLVYVSLVIAWVLLTELSVRAEAVTALHSLAPLCRARTISGVSRCPVEPMLGSLMNYNEYLISLLLYVLL